MIVLGAVLTVVMVGVLSLIVFVLVVKLLILVVTVVTLFTLTIMLLLTIQMKQWEVQVMDNNILRNIARSDIFQINVRHPRLSWWYWLMLVMSCCKWYWLY